MIAACYSPVKRRKSGVTRSLSMHYETYPNLAAAERAAWRRFYIATYSERLYHLRLWA